MFGGVLRGRHLAAVGLLTLLMTGCNADLAGLFEPEARSVSVPVFEGISEGTKVEDGVKLTTDGEYLYGGELAPAASNALAVATAGRRVAAPVVTSRATESLAVDATGRNISQFEQAVSGKLAEQRKGGDGPKALTGQCGQAFGWFAWEFATHCGNLFSDDDFPKVELTKNERDIIANFQNVNSRLVMDIQQPQTFTVTFSDNIDEAPEKLDMALFGVHILVADTDQHSVNVLYADGEWDLVRVPGSDATTVEKLERAEYTIKGTAAPLTRVAALISFGRSYRLATALSQGPSSKYVSMLGMIKFNTQGTPAPSDIVSVAYDLTIGDMTFQSE